MDPQFSNHQIVVFTENESRPSPPHTRLLLTSPPPPPRPTAPSPESALDVWQTAMERERQVVASTPSLDPLLLLLGAKPPSAMPARSTLSLDTQSGQRMTGTERRDRSMRAVERAKIFTIHGGGGLPAPACPGAGWGRDKTEDPFNAASPPPLSSVRPFVLFPFWALPKHHSPPPPLSPSFTSAAADPRQPTLVSPPRVIMAASS